MRTGPQSESPGRRNNFVFRVCDPRGRRGNWSREDVCSVRSLVIRFLVRNVNFKLFYFFQFAVELHETSPFFLNFWYGKFIYGPCLSSNSILKMPCCLEKELFYRASHFGLCYSTITSSLKKYVIPAPSLQPMLDFLFHKQ